VTAIERKISVFLKSKSTISRPYLLFNIDESSCITIPCEIVETSTKKFWATEINRLVWSVRKIGTKLPVYIETGLASAARANECINV